MTTPITGPFTKSFTAYGPPNSFGGRPQWLNTTRTWSRQRKPYNLPLAYKLVTLKIETYRSNDSTTVKEVNKLTGGVDQTTSDWAYSKCYSRFKDAFLQTHSEMSTTMAERQEALDMIAKRCIQLAKFTSLVRKFRWDAALKSLELDSKARTKRALAYRRRYGPKTRAYRAKAVSEMKLKRSARAFGDNWLEFHFGWAPLIDDIGNAVEVLQGDLPPIIIRARGAETRRWTEFSGSGLSSLRAEHDATVKWQMVAQVQINNPNLHLADQLGFINPVAIAWELVPFSFVVDWFVNVGEFLGSFTDFWGLSLRNPYRTQYSNWWQLRQYYQHPSRETWGGRSVVVDRQIGYPPGPALRVRPLKRLSVARGLTAASLLVKHLR